MLVLPGNVRYPVHVKFESVPPVARHLIWDWNGTLLDDVQACVRSINHLLTRRSLTALDEERYRRVFGFPVRGYYATLGFDFACEDWDALAREFHEQYDIEARDSSLRDGIVGLLAMLSARKVPMSVLSASESSILGRMLETHAISHHFAHICGLSDLYAGSKVQLGRKLLERLALPPAEVLLIGDTIHDYEVACELQCRCVLLAGGHQATDRLLQCECPVLTSPDQLASLCLS
jgi:phosphoglycolate phosphatase